MSPSQPFPGRPATESPSAVWFSLTVALLALLWVQPASALQDSRQLYQVPAVRVDEGPVLDGVLDDPVWRQAALIDQFIQQEPNEGAPATERTAGT